MFFRGCSWGIAQRLVVVQAVGGPTPLLVKTDKALAEHKAARESWAIGLGEGCGRRRCVSCQMGKVGFGGRVTNTKSACTLIRDGLRYQYPPLTYACAQGFPHARRRPIARRPATFTTRRSRPPRAVHEQRNVFLRGAYWRRAQRARRAAPPPVWPDAAGRRVCVPTS